MKNTLQKPRLPISLLTETPVIPNKETRGFMLLTLTAPALSAVIWAAQSWPKWLLMWALSFLLFFAAKFLTCRAARMPLWNRRTLAYFFAYAGMDGKRFQQKVARTPISTCEWRHAAVPLLAGAAFIWMLYPWLMRSHPLAAGYIGMTSLAMMLHFSAFQFAALAWNQAGVPVQRMMDRPLTAASFTDFWSSRWNRDYHLLIRQFVFQPIARRTGTRSAFWLAFLVSGLVHELVITVPAGAAYGGPLLYFLIQAAGITLERTFKLRHRALAWLFVLGSVPLLFPAPFVRDVICPFLNLLNGL